MLWVNLDGFTDTLAFDWRLKWERSYVNYELCVALGFAIINTTYKWYTFNLHKPKSMN